MCMSVMCGRWDLGFVEGERGLLELFLFTAHVVRVRRRGAEGGRMAL